jgi:phosphoglycerate dehydrogenase-like enzyme
MALMGAGPRNAAAPRTVVVTWPDYDVGDERLGGALEAAGLTVRLAPKLGDRSVAEVRALVADADGAIVSTDPFDATVLAAAPALRVIARVGVGVDSIDMGAATAHGVAVTVTPGANEATVADHTIALMLAVLRRVCEHDAAVRRGEWNRTGEHLPWVLSGTTVGLIGYGRIGRLVARRLLGFDVRVLVCDPRAPSGAQVEVVDLSTLLAESDLVSLHAPLEPGTARLIGAAEIGRMRPGAVLVNTARGGMIDEAALVGALRHGRLRGAALDVFADEPPRDSALLGSSRVVVTPHVAGLSDRSVDEMTRRATASVIEVLSDRRPRDVANPAVFEHPRFAGAPEPAEVPPHA